MSSVFWKRNCCLCVFLLFAGPLMRTGLAVESAETERLFGADDDPNSAFELTISCTKGSPEKGIELRVELKNVAEDPRTLFVCDSMTLCCVKNLSPLISSDNTQMGLLDVCKTDNPTNHEVFLPANASFAFDAAIPRKWLPEKVLLGTSAVTIQFCYALENGKTVHSNAIKVSLP